MWSLSISWIHGLMLGIEHISGDGAVLELEEEDTVVDYAVAIDLLLIRILIVKVLFEDE